jgi:mycothiol system anti-sigma-R factor
MDCSDITARLWEYLDGELAAKEAEAVDGHLSGCGACRGHRCCDETFLLLLHRVLSRPCLAPPSLRYAIRLRLAELPQDR